MLHCEKNNSKLNTDTAHGSSFYLGSSETSEGSDEEPLNYSFVEAQLKVSLCTTNLFLKTR